MYTETPLAKLAGSSGTAEPSKVLMAIEDAQMLVEQIADKLHPVIAYKNDVNESGPEKKVQSSVLSGIETLNKRLQELLKNIDL